MDITWTPLADEWVPEDLREKFIETAQRSRWVPVNGMHPMSPGLMLKEVVPQLRQGLGLKGISEVAYNEVWIIREDNHRLEPYAFDFMIHALIPGVQSSKNGMRVYLLDIGIGAVPIALVDLGRDWDDHEVQPHDAPDDQACRTCGRKVTWIGPGASDYEHVHVE